MHNQPTTRTSLPLETNPQLKKDGFIHNKPEIGTQLSVLLSDIFTLYIKTKSFHWHMCGPHFRDYHLMLDDQATQLFEMTDAVAERARKIGQQTIKTVEQIVSLSRLQSSDGTATDASTMTSELRNDNERLAAYMRVLHSLTSDSNDLSTTSLLEEWVDQAEERAWFLAEITAAGESNAHP
ncbi:DNA starvation/stationary phase protection protein [Pseudomonas sp. PP3]|uniref:Dps family protein n=1 Tax=Pseudomonas sp. PP3 TaxID=2815936 RepID=UPI001BB06185|nr:DNA starvation/stationary phase protection protein [Pseudomonas sp. PP3]